MSSSIILLFKIIIQHNTFIHSKGSVVVGGGGIRKKGSGQVYSTLQQCYLAKHDIFDTLTYIGPDGGAEFGAFWPFFWLGCLSMKEYSVPQTLSNINSLVLLLQIKKCCVHAANL